MGIAVVILLVVACIFGLTAFVGAVTHNPPPKIYTHGLSTVAMLLMVASGAVFAISKNS